MEVFIIKIKVKGNLKNLTENEKELINTKGIKNNNIISYIHNKTKYKLITNIDSIKLIRENEEIYHEILFKEHDTCKTTYYLKQLNSSLQINIETQKLTISENKINIVYKNKENQNIYQYVLDVSDNL